MSETSPAALAEANLKFGQMNFLQKITFIGKLIVFFASFALLYPNLLSD
jgi:hypothetical protein